MSDTAIHIHVHEPRGPDQPPAVSDLTSGGDEYPRDLDDLHDRLVRWFEESELARQDEIKLAERDREYFDHVQWSKEELD